MKKLYLLVTVLLCSSTIFAQVPKKDKGTFKEYKPGYFQNSILKGIEEFEKKDKQKKPNLRFKMDFSHVDIPMSYIDFTFYWHNEPLSQGNTGTCWCFSSTSYFESEIYRITGKKIKLSEMYTVYWEYVERAKAFVAKRGEIHFEQGSESNAVPKIWRKYGIVPADAYTGSLPEQTFHSHSNMMKEMKDYLNYVKESQAWNEELVVETIRNILNHYLGEPPSKVIVEDKEMTPNEYLKNIVKIDLDDFVDVLSLMQDPYWKFVEYKVPDNWWHSEDYFNIPLDDFMNVIKKSLKKGYTLAIGGDVSEAGFDAREKQAAVIPSFDIPSEYIDENARQFRFSNKSTTDDHGMHIVGYIEKDGATWFLLKDSGSGSKTGGKEKNKNFGYYFFHEDFIKLKMMDITVHKDMVKDLLRKKK